MESIINILNGFKDKKLKVFINGIKGIIIDVCDEYLILETSKTDTKTKEVKSTENIIIPLNALISISEGEKEVL